MLVQLLLLIHKRDDRVVFFAGVHWWNAAGITEETWLRIRHLTMLNALVHHSSVRNTSRVLLLLLLLPLIRHRILLLLFFFFIMVARSAYVLCLRRHGVLSCTIICAIAFGIEFAGVILQEHIILVDSHLYVV
jgi:hypothetical protein